MLVRLARKAWRGHKDLKETKGMWVPLARKAWLVNKDRKGTKAIRELLVPKVPPVLPAPRALPTPGVGRAMRAPIPA